MYELKAVLDEEQIRDKVWLVIDNLSVHYANALKRAYEPFHVLFLPAYTSPANPQEHVWATTKKELAVHFARLDYPVTTQAGFEAEVDYVLSQVKDKHLNQTFIDRMKYYLVSQLF